MKIYSTSTEGNAFQIMGTVRAFLKKQGKTPDEIKKVMDDMTSGNYEHLCEVAERETDNQIVIIR